MLSAQGYAENQYSDSVFVFMSLVLFPLAVAEVEIFLKGASFSQLSRLSFVFLVLSLLVLAGGGQVALVRDHDAKLL